MDEKLVAVLGLVLFYVLIMAIIGPFFTIWSLNTLFGFEIAYSFKTWMAVVWLTFIVHGIKATAKTDD
jgi:hypothetical protein